MFPRDKGPSIFRRAKWKLEKVWTFIRNIPDNVIMICQWVPVLWSNWDWDYNFLLNVLRYKLDRMQKHIGHHDRLVNSQKYAKQMKICVDLIDRIQKGEYTELEEKAHEEKWGELIIDSIPVPDDDDVVAKFGPCFRMDMYRVKAREQGLEEQEREEQRAIYDLAEKRKQRDYDVLFRIMRKRIQYWWD